MTGCPRCEAGDHTRGPRPDGLKHRATVEMPSIEQLEEWLSESGAEATDGCWVEPDGFCEHGHQSWLVRLGLI
jgi:hypothetical protein